MPGTLASGEAGQGTHTAGESWEAGRVTSKALFNPEKRTPCSPVHISVCPGDSFFFFKLFILLIFYFWLCWVFVSVRGLSPVAASGGHSSSRCAGLSLSQPLLLRSTGSRRAGSVVVAHGLSRSAACGIFPDQVSNPCPLHWQADS